MGKRSQERMTGVNKEERSLQAATRERKAREEYMKRRSRRTGLLK